MSNDEEKVCTKCSLPKPVDQFQPYKAKGYEGRRGVCKECYGKRWHPVMAAHAKRYYHENKSGLRDKVRARATAHHRTEAGHKMTVARNKRYEIRHPERKKARRAVALAIRSSKLIRRPCEVCGSPEVQAHHADYSKPLEVRWFCREHHGEQHREINRAEDKQGSAFRSGQDATLDGVVHIGHYE